MKACISSRTHLLIRSIRRSKSRFVRVCYAAPQRPVKIVVPYSAGGSADTLGRLIAGRLGQVFKQPFIIDNRGGAGGTLGSMAVAKAAPDGHTMVLSGIGSHMIAPVQLGNGMNPMKDFTHLALLGGPPTALVVNADLPIKGKRLAAAS